MSDGDYTIPTFPGVVGIGGHGGHGGGRHGLDGKDAAFLTGLHSQDGHRNLAEFIGKNSKEDALQTLENKFEFAKGLHTLESRLERGAKDAADKLHDARRELEKDIRNDGDKTRDLIRDMDEKRRRDARDAAVDAALISINAKLDILLP